MVKNVDHVTIAVTDINEAKTFFALLGFESECTVTIAGEPFVSYMNINGLKAEHVTLVLRNATPRFEIQLLKFYSPTPKDDININRLDKLGYNHLCFKVDNIEDEVEHLKSHGVKILTHVLEFHDRKLVYIEGPNKVILELAQWMQKSSSD